MKYLRFNVNTNGYTFCDEDEADFALVPIAEYHGLQKTLRIVRDRAKQQVSKSKTDEHGYRLLRADLRRFEGGGEEAWYITRQTPYSIKIEPEAAAEMILRDFKAFYHYVADATYTDDNGKKVLFESKDYIEYAKYAGLSIPSPHSDTDCERTAEIKKLYDAHKGKMVFRLGSFSANYGAGLYEVGYWATNVI